ncbi:uncharacterized protein LOC114767378 [Denticeps clupeoides]|uniref:uncharacterized protein LOC114767378 n=1 Tax=Denticeps clupeoides TaxID=299321 RepID=UPI0010A33EF0|nr:uncharacterized protein LOC114767378 [Denticeps clupeoides]XP_028814944.1 uncharacterized protein LOC114767378 [Denticeps clupeoides]
MSVEDEDDCPLWQSVVLFCCKGVIECIIVLLFIWLLVQVLFTKQLEVHLQLLLAVGLVGFCCSLVLGCVLCWRWKLQTAGDPVRSSPAPAPADHMTQLESAATGSMQYEQLEAKAQGNPSPFGSSTPSDDDFATLPLSSQRCALSDPRSRPQSCFPLRRLSSPTLSMPLYNLKGHGRTSLPSLSKVGLVSKTWKVLEHHCGADGSSECIRLTSRSPSGFQEEPFPPYYGSNSSCCPPGASLHFTLSFSPTQGTIRINLLSLTGTSQQLGGVTVLAALPPIHSDPVELSGHHLEMDVGSLEELQHCALRMTVFTVGLSGSGKSSLGELELQCGEIKWEPERQIACSKELVNTQTIVTSQQSAREVGGAPQVLGQLFILLQYQSVDHRIKVVVMKGENLANYAHISGAPDHHVMVHLRHKGVVIASKTTHSASGCNPVWKTSFLFELPPGDTPQMPLTLEFVVMKGRLCSSFCAAGRVFIGQDAIEDGQAHWRDMCNRDQVETIRWHTIQPL